MSLDGRGSAPDGLEFTWRQVSGPGARLSGAAMPVASFAPPGPGLYVFELAVFDGSRHDTDTVEVLVERRLRIEWREAGPLAVSLGSTHAGAPHSWDLGDGSTSEDETPRHTYAAAGTYLVRLTVTGADGRVLVAEEEVTVQGDPAPPAPLARPQPPSDGGRLAWLPLLLLGLLAAATGLLLLAGIRRRRRDDG